MTLRVSNLVEIIGVKVRATNEEIMTAPVITILNSRNTRPVVPCKKTIGKNTATKAIVVAIVLLLFGPWMMNSCIEFFNYIFELMTTVGVT